MRDDSVLRWDVTKSMREEIKMLEKMLAEQPPAPITLKEMLRDHLIGVTASSSHNLCVETYLTHYPAYLQCIESQSPLFTSLVPSM